MGSLIGSISLLTCSSIVEAFKMFLMFCINEYSVLKLYSRVVITSLVPIVGIMLLYILTASNTAIKARINMNAKKIKNENEPQRSDSVSTQSTIR